MHRLSLFTKLLLAMLLLSLLPLAFSSGVLFHNLQQTRSSLSERIGASVDRQSSENLEMRARQIADDIAAFLKDCEGDLRLAAALADSPAALRSFYDSRQEGIWYRAGTPREPRDVHEDIPRYQSLEVIDSRGRQRFVIRDGRKLAEGELKDVSLSENTEFKSETYFADTQGLKKGEIAVSRVTGFHVSRQEQLAGASDAENAVGGATYRGIVRFSTPLVDSQGNNRGIIVLSLDHRHLMEFTQHVLPGRVGTTVFPSYKSGNYAFLFDDEGWIITHPKFWDIRGVDKNGRLVPPYTAHSSKADIETGRIPFNLDQAGFVHENYPKVAAQVRRQKSGYVDITNVGGARKVMAYAPILYRTGDYARHGIFGAVTIGFQTDLFHGPARDAVGIIGSQLHAHLRESALILLITVILAVAAAWILSRSITRQLGHLTGQVRRLASGASDTRVAVTSHDELGELAENFNLMADQLEQRNNSLMETLDQLRHSRQQILEERNFKESILESITSAILSFSPDGMLLSVNHFGGTLLGRSALPGTSFHDVFREWDELEKRLNTVLGQKSGYGRSMLRLRTDGIERHFDIGIFPIGADGEQGFTVTIRDETEKERLRDEMTRLDRFASLGKLSAGIAHEVRNPLTGISLLLDDLHDRPGLDPDSQTMMSKALAEIERVERLISSLLNYASPPEACIVEGNLNLLVEDCLILIRRSCEKQGVELAVTLGSISQLPFDADRLRQLLLNLLGNALDAMPAGGRIAIETSQQDNWAVVSVSDTGPGISPEDLPLLFEPFFTRKSSGTGLGLSMVQRIVEEHLGTIQVDSTVGQGTVFTVKLPVERPGT